MRAAGTHDIGTAERRLATALIVAAALLRALYAFRYRVDSDEPQHLHVAWAWAHGLVQYRDVFDNHMPLFHLLTAPLVRALGERADIVPVMRLAMIPAYMLVLWCTYRLGRRLYSPRAGWWAAVFTAWLPPFFSCSLEFRADDLWAPLWLLTLVVASEGTFSPRRAFLAGVVAGAAIGTSMKTTLLLTTLGIAVVLTLALRPGRERGARWFAAIGWRVALGAAIIPALIAAAFAAIGAWQPFIYGAIDHNIVPGIGTWRRGPLYMLTFPATVAAAAIVAAALERRTSDVGVARRRIVLLLATAAYGGALAGVWPLITREDYLPFYPMLAVCLAPLLLAPLGRRQVSWVAIAAVVVEIVALFHEMPPWIDDANEQRAFVADVLQLTRAEDPVFDYKGESIFRSRPFFWVFERITKTRLDRGLIADTVPETLVATATHVAVHDSRDLSVRTRSFLDDHYVSVGRLRVAGQRLPCANDAPARFDVAIEGRYRMLSDGDPPRNETAAGRVLVMADVDGAPSDGGFLSAGSHELRTRHCERGVLLVWAPALERGFVPLTATAAVDGVAGEVAALGVDKDRRK